MKHVRRFMLISGCLLLSIIIIHVTKAPQKLSYQGFYVACLPANKTTQSDKQLIPYAQIAHTSLEENSSPKSWRCYFRFLPRDVICTPQSVASRQGISSCPHFPSIDGTSDKKCYVLNQKHMPLITMLQKKPPVSVNVFTNKKEVLVQTWQQVRDILLGKKK